LFYSKRVKLCCALSKGSRRVQKSFYIESIFQSCVISCSKSHATCNTLSSASILSQELDKIHDQTQTQLRLRLHCITFVSKTDPVQLQFCPVSRINRRFPLHCSRCHKFTTTSTNLSGNSSLVHFNC